MEENKIKAEELLKELKPCMGEQETQDWIAKLEKVGFGEDTATLIKAAYDKGCNEYNWRAWNAEGKYQKLCIAVCEKYII